MKEKQAFYGVIEKFNKDKARAKEELKQIVTNECKTYGDVERYLGIKAREARWGGGDSAVLLIEELQQEFDKDKNNLSLQ